MIRLRAAARASAVPIESRCFAISSAGFIFCSLPAVTGCGHARGGNEEERDNECGEGAGNKTNISHCENLLKLLEVPRLNFYVSGHSAASCVSALRQGRICIDKRGRILTRATRHTHGWCLTARVQKKWATLLAGNVARSLAGHDRAIRPGVKLEDQLQAELHNTRREAVVI